MKLRLASSLLAVFSIALLSSSLALAQQGQTSMGTDFWLGFMPFSFNGGESSLFIGSSTANVVHLDVYGLSRSGPVESYVNDTMQANSIWEVRALNEAVWEDDSCEQSVKYGIHVYSANPIVVYGFQQGDLNPPTCEGYLGIPTSALGTQYYTSCYYDDQYSLGPSNPLAGEFLIVSPYDDNDVTIGPIKTDTRSGTKDTTILHHQGDIWSVRMMKGETYLVQSTGTKYGNADLTGTHIVGSKPIGVISGHQLCSIPIGELANSNGTKDEIMEMIPTVDEWGSEYFELPTATRTACGDLVRIIAGDSNEIITATGSNGSSNATLLLPGDYYDFDECTMPTVFTSNNGKKFLAINMAYSEGYVGDPGMADPFSCVLPAPRMFQKAMVFCTQAPTGTGITQYATFICTTDSIRKIVINGLPINAYVLAGRAVFPGTNPQMEADRVQLPSGPKTFTAHGPIPFGCYLSGLANLEAYSDPAGLSLGINSTDSLPPLAVSDSSCGTFAVTLSDARSNDTHLADIGLITETGDLRWPKPSYNFELTLDSTFVPGVGAATIHLTVTDPTKDAYAALWTTDRAGNDTVYEYSYTAPKLSPPNDSSFDFGRFLVNNDYSFPIGFTNTSNTVIVLSSMRVVGTDTSILHSSPALPVSLQPGSSIHLVLGFSLSDTLPVFDTLVVTVGCAEFRYPIHVQGTTPIILAGDVDFGGAYLGDTVCQSAVIQNIGSAPLIIFPNYLLSDTENFTFVDANTFPDTIPPNGYANFKFCFHPVSSGKIRARVDLKTNIGGTYSHHVKDTSTLAGVGIALGVNSNTHGADFDVSVEPNPATGSVTISLTGAPVAAVEIFDVLGREVANFRLDGSYEWNLASLPAGTYIVRAETHNVVLSKRVIKR